MGKASVKKEHFQSQSCSSLKVTEACPEIDVRVEEFPNIIYELHRGTLSDDIRTSEEDNKKESDALCNEAIRKVVVFDSEVQSEITNEK